MAECACKHCHHWDGEKKPTTVAVIGETVTEPETGLCRCQPPVADIGGKAIWPETTKDDWCSAFAQKAVAP